MENNPRQLAETEESIMFESKNEDFVFEAPQDVIVDSGLEIQDMTTFTQIDNQSEHMHGFSPVAGLFGFFAIGIAIAIVIAFFRNRK